MITLDELFKVTWDITEIQITARAHDLHFLHQWIYGEGITETSHMHYERVSGNLTFCPIKINAHGDDNGHGTSEIGWGVKEELIPKELREAPVTHLMMRTRCKGGHEVSVDVEMQELTCAAVVMETATEE